MGLDQRELYRIRATMEKETKVGSTGVELRQPYGLYIYPSLVWV